MNSEGYNSLLHRLVASEVGHSGRFQDETSQKILGSSFTVERSSVPERNKRLEILFVTKHNWRRRAGVI